MLRGCRYFVQMGSKVTGVIPTELARMTALEGNLLLNQNHLSGAIPSQLGGLSKLRGSIALFETSLSGTIPVQLTKLSLSGLCAT